MKPRMKRFLNFLLVLCLVVIGGGIYYFLTTDEGVGLSQGVSADEVSDEAESEEDLPYEIDDDWEDVYRQYLVEAEAIYDYIIDDLSGTVFAEYPDEFAGYFYEWKEFTCGNWLVTEKLDEIFEGEDYKIIFAHDWKPYFYDDEVRYKDYVAISEYPGIYHGVKKAVFINEDGSVICIIDKNGISEGNEAIEEKQNFFKFSKAGYDSGETLCVRLDIFFPLFYLGEFNSEELARVTAIDTTCYDETIHLEGLAAEVGSKNNLYYSSLELYNRMPEGFYRYEDVFGADDPMFRYNSAIYYDYDYYDDKKSDLEALRDRDAYLMNFVPGLHFTKGQTLLSAYFEDCEYFGDVLEYDQAFVDAKWLEFVSFCDIPEPNVTAALNDIDTSFEQALLNELFARCGYCFSTEIWSEVFEYRSWYEYDKNWKMSSTEEANLEFLKSIR